MKNRFYHLLTCLALLITATGVFAATTATPPAPAKPKPAPPATGTMPSAPAAAPLKLEDYLNDLSTALKLADTEKKAIEDIYVADGDPMKVALNDESLSPLQQAQKVADLRDIRNAKIEQLLVDGGRKQTFLQVEAKYRVALTELAADGGWVAPPPPLAPAASTNAPATNAPSSNAPSTNAAPASDKTPAAK